MQFFAALFVALPLLVSSTALPRTTGGDPCGSNGQQLCCKQTHEASSYWTANPVLAAAYGITNPASVQGQIIALDIACIPIIGGAQCQSQTVCCNAQQTGLINVGCVAIQL
ncbi:hypothetical protein CYLTODRAFT_412962 [Cylindrobasidium torrendii FP15055 ss-10]|uniref:Hydrophobin n=1 Tax=Cylindrobasidium torrendii FP15055 ss-10 TaxID=1314674 RepID=A0A0D7B3Y9_9AGAR|nr:hypothetical protein CYLTODRAFT_412962 [Cylindrobasidium torrendii FP15055 ss-10]